MSVADAVRESRRAGLEAIRDALAAQLDEAQPGQAAGLAKQLAECMRELDSLSESKGSRVDDLARRRAARKAASEG